MRRKTTKTQRHKELFLIFVSLCLCGFSSIDAADVGRPAFHIFTDRDGLPQNSIMTMAIDQKGYIWAATEDGAAYYNGRKWTAVEMPNRTFTKHIRAILVASDGSIWFGRQDGRLSRLKDGEWTTFDSKSGLPDYTVRCLLETTEQDGTRILWAGTLGGGLARLKNGQWTIFDTKSGLPNNTVRYLLETAEQDGTRSLWVGTNGGGLARLKNSQWTIFDTKSGLPHNRVSSLLETTEQDGTRSLWVSTEGGGLARLKNGQWTIFDTKSGLPDNRVTRLLETTEQDGTRSFWVGTQGGLACLKNGRWTIFDTRSGLPNNIIWSLLETVSQDGRRSLWIGTDDGLARMESGQWITLDTLSGLPNNIVFSLLETTEQDGRGSLWVGTFGSGLAHLENGKWTIFDTKSGLPSNGVQSLLETSSQDARRSLWVGTDDGLARLENGRWTIFDTKSGLPGNGVQSLLETTSQEGTRSLWVGTQGGLARFENGKWTIFDTKSGLPINRVSRLLETTSKDGTGSLWVGTHGGGLARLENGKWTIFDTKSGLPSNFVTSLLETSSQDGRHYLWVGTFGGGVSRLDLDSKNAGWVTFSDATKPALPNNIIFQIREDAKKRIYLLTSKGIARLTPHTPTPDDPSEYSIYTFTTEDGLPSNECALGASMVDSKGRIWAGTVGGAAIFDPSKEVEERSPKPLYIESTLLAGKVKALSENESLAHNENSLSFESALLSYFRESDTRYRTQLVGLDEFPSDWTTDYKKEYTTLPEGSYLFKVWGRDYAGNISGPVMAAFKIRPAPWRTWWAYLFYAALVIGAGYSGHRYRLQVLERRNLMLEAKVEERTAELAKKNEDLIRSKEELVESHKQAEKIFTALSDVLPGTLLNDKYRLDAKIGSGGFGVVYRATHLELNRPVAVKVFRPTAANATTESLERFRREGASACRVNHPNAISILDSNVTTGGIAYLVMELLEGHTLTEELDQKGKLSLGRTIEISIPICDVLAKAHAVGIIHRDIKPDNIFLHRGENGEVVKVVDFGIAKLLGEESGAAAQSLTGTGTLIGTPVYMSPERLANKPYVGKADVYSLGVMLYEMLCGQLPFYSSEGHWQTALMHMTLEPLPPKAINPSIPEAVEAAVLRALRKDPEKRPGANELRQELLRALDFDPELQTTGNFKAIIYERVGTEAETPTAHFKADSLTDKHWTHIEKIFYSALEYEPDQRSAFLDEACGSDEALRKKVEGLIKADEKAEEKSFLNSPLRNKE
jgi:serine/threonine protein kinase/ligand-binding sensor domain-containing protein